MAFLYNFLIIILIILVLLKFYNVFKQRWCESKVCLNGKTAIVTGANTGIGYETALEFAKRGARVILACRNLEKATEARDKIVSLTENQDVIVKELNLGSLKSVRNFAEEINGNEKRLDILVNNAGCSMVKNKMTDDGLQILMQVNYFGPTLLTILVLDLLKKTGRSRIVNVSSVFAKQANLTVCNLNKREDSIVKIYGNSKLANIMFTIKLSELLRGSKVTVYSLHPGIIATNIFRNFRGIGKSIFNIFMMLYSKTPEEGAQTTLHTALEQNIEKYSGEHFEECKNIYRYEKARDPIMIEQIWQETIKLLQCEKEELF